MVFVTSAGVASCSLIWYRGFLFLVGVGFFFGRCRAFVVLRVVFLSRGIVCIAIGGC